MSKLLTYTGKMLDLIDPQPDQIDIDDIVQGLGQECRFGGQCRQWYSVAQHSVIVASQCPPELRLHALLHDAAEAYIRDVQRPLKVLLQPEYGAIEWRLQKVIYEALGVPLITDQQAEELHLHDCRVLAWEFMALFPVTKEQATKWACAEPMICTEPWWFWTRDASISEYDRQLRAELWRLKQFRTGL